MNINICKRWHTSRLALLFSENTQKNNLFSETHALQFKYGSLVAKKQYDLTDDLIDTYKKYTIIQPDDIIVNGLNLNYDFVTRRVALSEHKGIITYYLKALDSMKVFNGMGTGIRLTLSYDLMKNMSLPVPPRDEQDQIVRYLDWQVSKINRLIAAKRKQIELLKEHKEAFINTAVTRGVVDDIPLKESGMQWLPKIPAHWRPVPAKALFRNISELRRDNDPMFAATQKYGLIEQVEYMRRENRRIVLANDNLDKWLHVEPDDFIISLRSFQGGLEKCDKPGCVTWHYVVLRPQKYVYPPFYKWLFKSASYIGALQKTSDFIRDGQDLRYSNFVKVGLFVIPMTEQVQIADRLDSEIPKYQKAIESLEQEIQQIIEYRTRLISDVVTGQIDVRGIEVPDYEYCDEAPENAAEESSDADYDTEE